MKPHCTALAIRPDCPRAREIPRQLVTPVLHLPPILILFAKHRTSRRKNCSQHIAVLNNAEAKATKAQFYADHKGPEWTVCGDITFPDIQLPLSAIQLIENPRTGFGLPGSFFSWLTAGAVRRRWLSKLFTA